MSCVSRTTAFIKENLYEGLFPTFTRDEIDQQPVCIDKIAFVVPRILRTLAVYTAVGALSYSVAVLAYPGSIFAFVALGAVVGVVAGTSCIAIKFGPEISLKKVIDNIVDNIYDHKNCFHVIWAGEKPALFLSTLITISFAIICVATAGLPAGSAALGSAVVLFALKLGLITGATLFALLSALNLFIVIRVYFNAERVRVYTETT